MSGGVEVVQNPERHRFEAEVDGGLAVLDYRSEDGRLILDHTGVPEAAEGKGVGSALARAALEHARVEGLRVTVHCPFVRSWLRRHPEYHDLLEGKPL